jgi:hypothetical protein
MIQTFNDLNEMYRSRGFQIFQESKLGNDLFINDPDRAKRIYDAAEEGCEGSTHAEVMEDWREYLDTVKIYIPDMDTDVEDIAKCDITQATYDAILKEIDECEAWHEKNGSLHNEIG